MPPPLPTSLVSPPLTSFPPSLPPLPQENGIDYKIPTAIATSLTNIVGIAFKDRAFARMLSKSPASFPLPSYFLFGLRDGMTVTSTFVLKVRLLLPSLPPSLPLPG